MIENILASHGCKYMYTEKRDLFDEIEKWVRNNEAQRVEIRYLVEEGLAGAEVCTLSGRSILAHEEIYMLAGLKYHINVDIESELSRLTDGSITTKEDAYDDDSDWFYFTENDDFDEVFNQIMEQGYYYDRESVEIPIL